MTERVHFGFTQYEPKPAGRRPDAHACYGSQQGPTGWIPEDRGEARRTRVRGSRRDSISFQQAWWQGRGLLGAAGVDTSGQDPGLMIPSRWAMVAASTRPCTPSLPRMLETCTVAVLGLMNSVSAIWRLVRPSAISASTSCSRAVRPSRSSGDGGWGAGGGVVAASVPRLRR